MLMPPLAGWRSSKGKVVARSERRRASGLTFRPVTFHLHLHTVSRQPTLSLKNAPTLAPAPSSMAGLTESLLEWMDTFVVSAAQRPNVVTDLADGVLLGIVLSKVYPAQESRFLGWALDTNAAKNMSKVLQALGSFHGPAAVKAFSPDALAAGKDAEGMEKLLVLLLCAAVHCDNKVAFISDITQLDSEVQMSLMSAIETTMRSLDHIAAPGQAASPLHARHRQMMDSPSPSGLRTGTSTPTMNRLQMSTPQSVANVSIHPLTTS